MFVVVRKRKIYIFVQINKIKLTYTLLCTLTSPQQHIFIKLPFPLMPEHICFYTRKHKTKTQVS